MKKSLSIESCLFFLMGLFSTMTVLRYNSVSFFKFFAVISIFLFFLYRKNIKVSGLNSLIILSYILMLCTLVLSVLFPVGASWKNAAMVQFFWFSVYFLFYFLYHDSKNMVKYYLKGLYCSLLVQCIWVALQYVSYIIAQINLNKLIFTDTLRMTTNSYHLKGEILTMPGLAWHESNLVPILVALYWLSKHWYIKLLLIILSVISQSSTALLLVLVCVFIDLFVSKHNKKITKKNFLISLFALGVLFIFIFLNRNILSVIYSRTDNLFNRLADPFSDSSSKAHINYILFFPKFVNSSSLIKFLFGYGEGCSGYIMTLLTGQYSELSSWAMECDIANVFWNRGLTGFIVFYLWLFMIAKRGKSINPKYVYLIVTVVIAGLFYNIQYDWVIVSEIVLTLAVANHIDVFESSNIKRFVLKTK